MDANARTFPAARNRTRAHQFGGIIDDIGAAIGDLGVLLVVGLIVVAIIAFRG